MITRVIKRDGREAVFNIEKIANAIHKALDASQEINTRDPNRSQSQISMNISSQVADRIDDAGNSRPTIEQIQDLVEHVLMENGYPETAKRYIIYRAERTRVREMKTHLMQSFHAMNPLESEDSDIATNSNEILLQYGLTGAQSYNILYLLRPEVSQAHLNRDLFLHDLEYYALTFSDFPIDLKKQFAGEFVGGHAADRESGDIRSYADFAATTVTRAQNEISGCPTLAHFDRAMADGVQATRANLYQKYLDLFSTLPALTTDLAIAKATELAAVETVTATRQAMASLLKHWQTNNLCTPPHRTPLSIQYGLETSDDARLVTQEILHATRVGPGQNGHLPAPRQLFLLADGVNLSPGDPNYDLFLKACECCAAHGTPQFAMADPDYLSLARVTINLPRCAILARNDLNLFNHRLENQLELAIGSLLERHSALISIRRRNFPFVVSHVQDNTQKPFFPNETMAEIIANEQLSVNFVGLSETLTSLVGRNHGQREDATRLGLEIVTMMRDFVEEAAERHGVKISLSAGQEEWIARELITADRTRFGKIAGVTDGKRYSAGFSLPARMAVSTQDRIRIEAPYHHLVHCGQLLTIYTPAAASPNSVVSEYPNAVDWTTDGVAKLVKQAAQAKIRQVQLIKKSE
ncbi:MAG: anaerobic ribonucleoside-triphosphate reductase [Eubacteriales bacterium]|nr:anaerobic ribonucleoside-triphosphate reductase [Eubacteriales bacterium]